MVINWKRVCALTGVFLLSLMPSEAAMTFPNINIGMGTANTPQDFTNGLQILIWLTILTLAPSILIMTTSFIRLVVVLSLTRQAIGAGNLPPNQVITSLALILTFFIMAPTFNEINEKPCSHICRIKLHSRQLWIEVLFLLETL